MKLINPPEERIVAYKGVIYELSVNLAEERKEGENENEEKKSTKIKNVELQEELTQIVKCMVKTSEESEKPVYSDNFSVTLTKEPCFLGRKYKFRSSVDSSPLRISENKLVFTATLLPCGVEKNKSSGLPAREKMLVAPLLTPICSTPPTTPKKASRGSDVKDMSDCLQECFELRVGPPITPGFYSEDVRVFKKVVNRRKDVGNNDDNNVIKFDLENGNENDEVNENGNENGSEGNSLLLYTPILKKNEEISLVEETPEKKISLENENENEKEVEEEEEESKMLSEDEEKNNDSMELYTQMQNQKRSPPSNSSSSSTNKKRTNGNKGSSFFRGLVDLIKKYFPINLLKDN